MKGWIYYPVTPLGKPRMTRKDKFAKRPIVQKYWAYKAEIRLRKVMLPEAGAHVIFILPMPKSWTKARRAEMLGQPHQQTPDKDNLEKGLLDALFDEDCSIWDSRVSKVWGRSGAILIGPIGAEVADVLKLFEV